MNVLARGELILPSTMAPFAELARRRRLRHAQQRPDFLLLGRVNAQRARSLPTRIISRDSILLVARYHATHNSFCTLEIVFSISTERQLQTVTVGSSWRD